ncbi:hypothetical protein AAZX31_08G264200 [Glycine max]
MDESKNRHNDNLGVNKMGKNIRKSPLHQPNYGNNNNSSMNGGRQQQQQPQPQPQVYNISKNDFRDIVQQLTGSPSQSQDHPQSKPPQNQNNSPKPQSMRLQKIRPPPLPYVRPPLHTTLPAARPAHFRQQPSPNPNNIAESPISAYMRYLEHSITDPTSRGAQFQPHHHPASSALLPNPPMLPLNATNPLPPPPAIAAVPSPQPNGPPILPLPSPTSQFLLPSPNDYMNFLSPQSCYRPLLSPGIQFPSPFTPHFPLSPFAQSGILGPGPQPPLSPGLFPLSPSGFFPMTSPRSCKMEEWGVT